jgi:glycosyltransferase
MFISVITVCWNAEKTIRHTVESFLSQTHPDKEMVLVDGASKDATLDIVRSFKSPLIKITSEKDKGIYDAMNKGLKWAKGDAIGLLNADDTYYDAHSLAKIAKALETSPLVSGNCEMVPDHVSGKIDRHWRPGPYRPGAFSRGWMPPHPCSYARREVYEKVGGFDLSYKICADYEWLLRAIEVNKFPITMLDEPLAHMMLGGLSTAGFKSRLTNLRETHRARQKWLGAGPIDMAMLNKAFGALKRAVGRS